MARALAQVCGSQLYYQAYRELELQWTKFASLLRGDVKHKLPHCRFSQGFWISQRFLLAFCPVWCQLPINLMGCNSPQGLATPNQVVAPGTSTSELSDMHVEETNEILVTGMYERRV
jgi:hypothetical protein